jgi:hypothetical protein
MDKIKNAVKKNKNTLKKIQKSPQKYKNVPHCFSPKKYKKTPNLTEKPSNNSIILRIIQKYKKILEFDKTSSEA